LLGVSVRTLQGWEQGRKQASGAARTLLTIARANPKALLAVPGKWSGQLRRCDGCSVKQWRLPMKSRRHSPKRVAMELNFASFPARWMTSSSDTGRPRMLDWRPPCARAIADFRSAQHPGGGFEKVFPRLLLVLANA